MITNRINGTEESNDLQSVRTKRKTNKRINGKKDNNEKKKEK